MKRIFSILLALIMVFSLVPFMGLEAEALMRPEKSVFYITYTPGSGATGSSYTDGPYDVGSSVVLKYASELGYKKEGYYCTGWSLGSEGSTYTNKGSGSLGNDKQYYVTATAQWAKEGSSSSSSSSSGSSSSSSSSNSQRYTVTYNPGEAEGNAVKKSYDFGDPFYLISNPFTYKGHTFEGWEYSVTGAVYSSGHGFEAPDRDISFTAVWSDDGVKDITGSSSESSESSSSSSSSSSASSSKSSSASSSKSSSASSSKSSSASSSKSSSSSSSSSVSESVSESEVSSESSSSVVEVPEVDTFEPISLAFSIDGDIPVTKIEFVLKEDIGENPTLSIVPIDGYSVTDEAAAKFIADGDALAAFDISVLVDGFAYEGNAKGTVNYELNGTQASASSNYETYVLAMVHTVRMEDYFGDYYMTDGENTYLYTPETDFKTAVANVKLLEDDGVYRLVIVDPAGLSTFAYRASDRTVVEVKLLSSASAPSAYIDVESLSPVMLVQIEVGSGKASGGIPVWVWIVIAVVAVVMIALVALFLLNRSNERKREALNERQNMAQRTYHTSSGITGFDDEE